MSDDDLSARDRQIAKKARAAREGAVAMAEYERNAIATREKTAKLKALRLARDAQDAAALAAAGPIAAPKKKARSRAAS